MIITVNDEAIDLTPESGGIFADPASSAPLKTTLSDLLSFLDIQSADGLALAVNNSVISREKWNHFSLSEHDSVLIITATQGG